MNIGGLVKNSFIDYPQKISCVVFTIGCNMNCWYCHNRHLIENKTKIITENKVLSFLEEHKTFLDAVTISGGEPTMQSDLIPFIQKIKSMGFLVKLDTNGTNFNVLKNIIENNLVDFVALDVKTSLEKYSNYATNEQINNIKNSIELLKQNKVNYEFRTTFEPNLTLEDILSISKLLEGAENYSIQQYNKPKSLKNFTQKTEPVTEEYLIEAKDIASKYIKNVTIKGL